MNRDGSPEHLTWDGLIKDEAEEIKSEAVNAQHPTDPPPSHDPTRNGFAPPPPPASLILRILPD